MPVVGKQDFIKLAGKDKHEVQRLASIKNWKYFNGTDPHQFRVTRLRINNRLEPGQEKYRAFLKVIGAGLHTDNYHEEHVQVPKELQAHSREEIIKFVFEDMLDRPLEYGEELCGRAILCITNEDAFKLNQLLMNTLKGKPRIYKSLDTAIEVDAVDHMAVNINDGNIEQLNRKTPRHMPQHVLEIKEGAIMMINTNVAVEDGLCNGTRVQIISMHDNYLWCRFVTGARKGQEFPLTRFRFQEGGEERINQIGGVPWTREQFPLRPGFVLTINKAQGSLNCTATLMQLIYIYCVVTGQTLEKVGVVLDHVSCFAHGQLYVAASRVRRSDCIRFLLHPKSKGTTRNVVQRAMIPKEEQAEAKEEEKLYLQWLSGINIAFLFMFSSFVYYFYLIRKPNASACGRYSSCT